MKKVLVTSRSFSSGDLDLHAYLLDNGIEIIKTSTSHEVSELRPLLADCEGWIAGTAQIGRAHV